MSDHLPGTVVDSLSDYLGYVEESCGNFRKPLFRGHADETWSLVPRLGRVAPPRGSTLRETESRMFLEFKRRAIPHFVQRPSSDWEWLAIAQHNGLPTRLLDWTGNPLAALWFAVNQDVGKRGRGGVWILHAFEDDYVDSLPNGRGASPFGIAEGTRVFRPEHSSPRITAQDGWFTLHHLRNENRFIPLEGHARYHKRLSYVAVPATRFAKLRAELDRCGVHSAALFPDLPGLAQHLATECHTSKPPK